ncbi:MAG TPA: M64 family metallopeptidase [Thermoanaerobaculia bacterium]|nr:M64 family metallopeptidase [Thermoanaerobaculia bacterium]
MKLLKGLLALVALLGGPAVALSAELFPAHYIVFSVDADGKITPEFYRRVTLAAPLVSRTENELASLGQAAGREEEALELRLADAEGQVVFQDTILLPQWVRGEFHGASERGGWRIEGHRFPLEPRAFVVRVPATGEQLSLAFMNPARSSLRATTFDLKALAARADLLPKARPAEGKIQTAASTITGNSSNRVDLLIMGDGYTSAEQAKFNTDAMNLETNFFKLSPYSEYVSYFNRVVLFTASAQSGADHPPYAAACATEDKSCCADPAAQDDPLAGRYVSTAFEGRFCAFNVQRLAVVNDAAVLAAAAAYPEWDKILVLLNDDTYGGSGGGVGVASTNVLAVDIARHEFGHSFTKLADEYDSPFPGYPFCSDLSSPHCEANVTDQTSRALIKWAPWINAATPIPTPENNPSYANTAGLFLGARYNPTGMYRHRDTECLMNFLGKPFGEVCAQEFVLQLYRGGWGKPAAGIDLIEPGSENPAPGSYTIQTSATFSAQLLGPATGPAPEVTWKVNGVTVPGAQGKSYTFVPGAPGTYQVTLEARDATPLVQPAMAGSLLQSSRTWTVTRRSDTSPCVASDTVLCLNHNRFRVEASFQAPGQPTGTAHVSKLTDETGYLWFFAASNVEAVLKVIDACSFNQRFWVYAGGLTDVRVDITVTDTKTGTVKTYSNPQGAKFQPIQDSSAFNTCP